MKVEPITLSGNRVRLEPLNESHADDLFRVGQTPEIWTYLRREAFSSLEDTREWIEDALRLAAAGAELPFAIIHLPTGKAVGSTRYLEITPEHRRLEIGWTWLAREHWRTPLNTESKYLLLRHAFETLGCLRVQLKTDLRNTRSQQAIERLGAVREGLLRKYIVLALKGNYQRSSVIYSIIDDEWPQVKANLEAAMWSVQPNASH